MDNNLFAHRFDSSLADVHDGKLVKVPSFCKGNRPKCMEFYKRMLSNTCITVCPYGFAVEHCRKGSDSFFNIGLSIEGVTQHKDIERKLQKNEKELRLTKQQYNTLVEEMLSRVDLKAAVESKERETKERSQQIDERQTLLEDTIHEVRKINNQLKSTYERLAEEIEPEDKYVSDMVQTLYGNTNLLTIRLDFYDYMVNPQLLLSAEKTDIPIYRKFEKVYKCLYNSRTKKNIDVRLENNSYGLFSATPMMEIAIFIILENAIKYSPEHEIIRVVFDENRRTNRLVVNTENWGPFIEQDEKCKIFDRGYRGRNAVSGTDTKGQGLGLHILKQICESNNIKLEINTREQRFIQQVRCSKFSVKLTFEDILL